MIQPNIRGGICHASARYSRANNKLMGSLYEPRQPTSYIMEIGANKLHGWAMSQEMPDGNFEWLSQDEGFDMGMLLNYADGRIAIFDTKLFDHRENEKDKTSLNFVGGLGVPAETVRAR